MCTYLLLMAGPSRWPTKPEMIGPVTPVDPPSHASAPSVPPPDGPDWVLQLHTSPDAVDAARRDALLATQDAPTPFMSAAMPKAG